MLFFFFEQPLEQFSSKVIFHVDTLLFQVSFTTMYLYLLLNICSFLFVHVSGLQQCYFIPTSFQLIIESFYKFLLKLVLDQVGTKAVQYFTLVFTLFFALLFGNVIGLTPFAFTVTSHILFTFSFGFSVITSITIIGFQMQGIKFLQLFVPKDVHLLMLPLLMFIEFVSYISRGLSLSIRLFANIMAGHTLLNILSSFSIILFEVNSYLFSFSLGVIFGICLLELALAGLQAYVFVVLTVIYLADAFHSH